METLTKLQAHLSETADDWQKEEKKHDRNQSDVRATQRDSNFGI
jgi:hypothetical protein